MRDQQPEAAQTDNFALFTVPFDKAPLTLQGVDVSAPASTFYVFTGPSALHAPPLLQPAQHRKSSRTTSHSPSPTLRFSSTTRSCNTSLAGYTPDYCNISTLASPSRYSTSGNQTALQLALLHGLTQQLSTTPLFSLQTRLLQHPPLSLEQIYAPPPQRPQQRPPLYNRTVHNAAPTTNRSSAITSLCKLCASLPPPEAAPVTDPPPTLASASVV